MRRFLVLLAFALAAGCSTTEDTIAPPVELPDFDRSARLTEDWRGDTGDAFNRRWVRMAPWHEGGRVFTANVAGQVTAWAAEGGRRLWRVETDEWLSAGVGGGGGRVYVGTAQGTLIALDAETGETLWRHEVRGEMLAPPATSEAFVVVRTVDGRIVALAPDSGERLWTYSSDVPPLSLRGNSEPVPVQGGVVVGLDNGRLVALQSELGQPLWETTIEAPEGRSPIERMVDIDGAIGIGRGVVYAATYDGRIAQVTPQQGNIRWERELSSYAGLTVDGERVYVTDSASHVRALEPDSGATLWRQDKLAHRQLTAPVPIPGTPYLALADYNGYVHILARADGRIVARTRAGDSFGILADPVPIGEGRFLVQARGGWVSALSVAPLAQ